MIESLLTRTLAAIEPVDDRIAARARSLLAREHAAVDDGLNALAARIAASRHTLAPRLGRKHVLICAADHGAASAEPGSATTAALAEVAAGRAAVNTIARTAGAGVLIVDCGVDTGEPPPPGVMDLRVGPGTADICRGPAMPREAAETALQTGIALMISLADSGADCVALGQLAPGSQVVATALIAALAEIPPRTLEPEVRDPVARALTHNPLAGADAIDVLAALGGFDIGVLAGAVLAAASLRIPVVLDDRGTSAAALVAARLAPAVTGYAFAAHAGTGLAHKQALHVLGLSAIYDMGISHGEGAGAAMALPALESAARVLCECADPTRDL